MQFLNQPIEFEPLPGHAAPTFAARAGAPEWLAFCSAAREAKRRLVALWGSDERDREPSGFAL
ncbi:MAG: Ni,Fe-hydrogenase III large subunit, partial [Zoogloeaceae bacterium]|nr:Ni,Fe-hydrogenase III large subunit [Zoogloeaceae bacterium]